MRLFLGSSVLAVTLGALAACGGTTGTDQTGDDGAADSAADAAGDAGDDASGDGAETAIGEGCIPGEESIASFSGFSVGELSIESRPRDCSAGQVCLANHFQGRVSCPYGQEDGAGTCFVTETDGSPSSSPVAVPVDPQLLERRAVDTVLCSCRCAGPDTSADYCACPGGFICAELVASLGLGSGDLAGSYCIPEGTLYDKSNTSSVTCDPTLKNCEP